MKLCAPLIIYALFCLIQIIIDLLEGLYNSAGMKTLLSIAVSALLYLLCSKDYLLISWIIVLVPFLFMSFTSAVLLYNLKRIDVLDKKCDKEDAYVKKTILNEPRYKHGYTHLYKYTTTPVKMRFEPIRGCDEEKEEEDEEDKEEENKIVPSNYVNKYFADSDPQYESFK